MTGSGYHNFDYSLARKVMDLLKVTQKYYQKLVLEILDCLCCGSILPLAVV